MKRGKRNVPASSIGLLLGLVLAAGGLGLLITAPEMAVSHAAIKYVRSSVEHVSHAESQFYGVFLLLAGLAIFGISLPRTGK